MAKIFDGMSIKIFGMFIFITFMVFLLVVPIPAQDMVYVDSKLGSDNNPGTKVAPYQSLPKAMELIKGKDNNIYTIKINPGIYVLDDPLTVNTEKNIYGKQILIEANILPDDTSWTPEKMPVVICTSVKGEIPNEYYHFVASFLINESHVTIRGIKFPGYIYPNTRYFPIARFNKEKTDLSVEQCLFVGDDNASHLQVGIIAHGNKIRIDHCVFYKTRNAVVYWQDVGDTLKTGNSFTNSIVYGASQCAVWLAWPDKDFLFKNNVVSDCKFALIKNSFNQMAYTINNSIIVNNQYYQGVAAESGVEPAAFRMKENNIIKNGKVTLRMKKDNVDEPLPIDYMHPILGSPGYNSGVGLFKKRKY